MKVGVLLAGALVAVGMQATAVAAQDGSDRPRVDEIEFINSCSSCHGTDGKGAGFLTRLFRGVDPGDLTLLAQSNEGVFPTDRVFDVIDGRAEVAAHGDRKMPVWGDRYMDLAISEWGPDEINTLRARNRVFSLVLYLQSIQEIAEN
ncbi:MAG: cytochrome c [Paracoccaceae bacterium]|nr:cytochrome c [Paracoccaceae bacterium]